MNEKKAHPACLWKSYQFDLLGFWEDKICSVAAWCICYSLLSIRPQWCKCCTEDDRASNVPILKSFNKESSEPRVYGMLSTRHPERRQDTHHAAAGAYTMMSHTGNGWRDLAPCCGWPSIHWLRRAVVKINRQSERCTRCTQIHCGVSWIIKAEFSKPRNCLFTQSACP